MKKNLFLTLVLPFILNFNVNANHQEELANICDEYWQFLLNEFPEYASQSGDYASGNKWCDYSMRALMARKDKLEDFSRKLENIDITQLDSTQKVSYRLLKLELIEWHTKFHYQSYYLALSPFEGLLQATMVLTGMPQKTIEDYQMILARLKALPPFVTQVIDLLQEGVKKEITLPKICLQNVPERLDHYLEQEINKNPFCAAFENISSSLSVSEQEDLRQQAQEILTIQLIPAFQELKNYVQNSYIPACREDTAWSTLPNGVAWYQSCLQDCTNSNHTAQEIHEIGLKEVARITKEIEKIFKEVEHTGDLASFLDILKHNPIMFFNDKKEALMSIQSHLTSIESNLLNLFYKLPRVACNVEPVPSHDEKAAPTAFYFSGSLQNSKPGIFYINTFNLNYLHRWELQTITLHEAIPGHHMQLMKLQELENIPMFRLFPLTTVTILNLYNAYIEGWALYCENLGQDLGLYQDPYTRFGKLSLEMLRAVRLVVDTGLHAMGWQRQEAINYLNAHTGMPFEVATMEIDRYIMWPAQALSYKMGELTIKELREKSEKQLGNSFDIREFHELILSQGSVTLDILEDLVNEWIGSKNLNTIQVLA